MASFTCPLLGICLGLEGILIREKGMLGWTTNDDSHLPELDANLDSQPPQNANLDSLLHLMPSQSPPQNRADSQSESLPVEESQSQSESNIMIGFL